MSGVVLSLADEEDEDLAEEFRDDSRLLKNDRNWKIKNRESTTVPVKKPSYSKKNKESITELLNTFTLCLILFGVGTTQSLLKPQHSEGAQNEVVYSTPHNQAQMASAIGYFCGFIIGVVLFSKLSRLFIVLMATIILAILLLIIPWSTSIYVLNIVFTLIGVLIAILWIGCNTICLSYWKHRSGPYIQTLHFFLSLGLLIAPLMVDPIAEKEIPSIITKPFESFNSDQTFVLRQKREIFLNSRVRRSKNRPIPGPFSPYGNRISVPLPPRYPILPANIGWDDKSMYDDYEGGDMNLFEPPIKKPPGKVKEAIETIADYLHHPNKEFNKTTESSFIPTSSTIKTTMIVTTTMTTTEKLEITSTTATTTVENVTESQENVTVLPETVKNVTNPLTILSILTQYGVSHRNIGFILDSVYTFIISCIIFCCLCYNQKDPSSSLDEGSKFEENRIFKSSVTILLFLFSLLHWGMFVSLREVLPRFNNYSTSTPHLQRVFIGMFTTSRFLAIFSSNIVPAAAMIFGALTITFIGSLILVFVQEVSEVAVWSGVILQAVGLSTLIPSSLAWGENYISMSSQVVSIIGIGLALGELGVPGLLTQLTIKAQTWLGFAMVGATILSGGLFLCAFLMAKKQGHRAYRPSSVGYELASTEESSDELLEEDFEDQEEDFEMAVE